MNTHRPWPGFLKAALSLALLGLLYLTLAPTQVGGRTAYVIVTGNSMQPHLRRGDLVLLRASGDYQVGDVVAYRHPELGQVIHRIVAAQGDCFVLQGDHNAWTDSYAPQPADVIGELWIHVPRAGSALWGFRSPLGAALLAGVLGVFLLWPEEADGAGGAHDSGNRRPRRLGDLLDAADFGLSLHALRWLGRTTLSLPQGQRLRAGLAAIGAEKDGLPLLLCDRGALLGRTGGLSWEAAAVMTRGTRHLRLGDGERPPQVWVHLELRSSPYAAGRVVQLYCIHLTRDLRLLAVWDGAIPQSALRQAAVDAAHLLRSRL